MRGYAWSFGQLHQPVHGHLWLLRGLGVRHLTTQFEVFAWLLSIAIFFYLSYPGVRD